MTPNFKESEVVNWPTNIAMSAADRNLAIQLANDNITPAIRANAKRIAEYLQLLRDMANAAFPQYNGSISLVATSWYRPEAWERMRNRDGSSRHTKGDAVDFMVRIRTGAQTKDEQEVMAFLWRALHNWHGGLARKMNGSKWSFIHIDLGAKRRWTY